MMRNDRVKSNVKNRNKKGGKNRYWLLPAGYWKSKLAMKGRGIR